MSVVTSIAIEADIGGYVGHSVMHPDLLTEAKRRVAGRTREWWEPIEEAARAPA